MKKIMKNKNKGFTIVELIVVMAIIAILILIAVPTFTKYIDNANKTSEMGTGDTIYKAAMAAVVEDYVTTGDVLVTDLAANIKAGVDGTATITVVPYTTAPDYTTGTPASTAWGVYIKGTVASSKIAVDATGDIYMMAPVNGNGTRNVYKNGDLSTTVAADGKPITAS